MGMEMFNNALGWAKNNPMESGSLGLGALDMLMGALSRNRYGNQMEDYRKQAMDAGGWQRFYQPMSENAMEQINRGINGGLALRGIQDGQAGTRHAADAWAAIEAGRQNQAMSGYQQALGNMRQGIQQPYGGGTLGGIMQQLMILRALRGQGQPTPNPQAVQGPFMGYQQQQDASPLNYWGGDEYGNDYQ